MTPDLSLFHHPVGDLFAPQKIVADLESYGLTAEQIEFYEANGYLSGIRLLSDRQVEALRTELEQPSVGPSSDYWFGR